MRNLLIGRKLADKLGGAMKSGWLLDNFGQISQTAQIHRLAGIEGLFVWRGLEMEPQAVKSEFIWESPDGSRIPAVYLLNSYRNVMRLAEYHAKNRMDAEVEKLKPFAGTSHLLMMNGYDQEMIPDDIQLCSARGFWKAGLPKRATRIPTSMPLPPNRIHPGRCFPGRSTAGATFRFSLGCCEWFSKLKMTAFRSCWKRRPNLFEFSGWSYRDLAHIEDMGDCYDYSYPDRDRRITSEGGRAVVLLERSSELEAVFLVERILELPVGAAENRTMRSRETTDLPIVTYVTLQADSPVVRCRTFLKNTSKDHRMRVLIPTGIDAGFSCAGSPFDIARRPVKAPDYEELPEALKRVIVGAREAAPDTMFHNREFVDLHDGCEGLAVFNKGLSEYQIINGDTIALTLFRSVGRIAGEINTRIGDAGPEILTPDAQCLREMRFEYAICPHAAYAGVWRITTTAI